MPLPLQSVFGTANSLSEHLADLGDTHPFSNLPTLPTACAILLLALESEARTSLPNIGDLAHRLATHHSLAKSVVMSRYKLISDLIEESVKELPWLDQFQTKNGRSPIGRRVIVARGLKDVIQFRAEIRAKKLESVDDEPSEGAPVDGSPNDSIMGEMPRKRRKTSKSLRDATHFLLNPSSASLPSPIAASSANSRSQPPPLIGLTSYLLTAHSSDSLNKLPTRLQRLVAERGEQAINDEELFDDPEWEAIFRSEQEIEVLRESVGWESEEVRESGDEDPTLNPSSKRRPKNERPSGSKRINQEVLSRLLQHRGTFGEDDLDWIGGIGQFTFSDEDGNSDQEEPTSDQHSGDQSGQTPGSTIMPVWQM
jgi:transcription factor IIIB subunit 2